MTWTADPLEETNLFGEGSATVAKALAEITALLQGYNSSLIPDQIQPCDPRSCPKNFAPQGCAPHSFLSDDTSDDHNLTDRSLWLVRRDAVAGHPSASPQALATHRRFRQRVRLRAHGFADAPGLGLGL